MAVHHEFYTMEWNGMVWGGCWFFKSPVLTVSISFLGPVSFAFQRVAFVVCVSGGKGGAREGLLINNAQSNFKIYTNFLFYFYEIGFSLISFCSDLFKLRFIQI